jgi:hypothetical protein
MTLPAIGQIPRRANIVNITNSFPCEVTTQEINLFPNKSFVRFTDLNGAMPIPRGEDPINNARFRIIVTSPTTFFLQNPITFKFIDSTTYPTYVEKGFCNLIQENYIYHGSEINI